MPRQIFRKAALERLSSPEQLDRLMQVTSPRAWIALAALGLLLVAALAWGLFGTVTTTVEGQGVLIRQGGVRTVTAPAPGVVGPILVQSGYEVGKDQELLRLEPARPGAPRPPPVVSS